MITLYEKNMLSTSSYLDDVIKLIIFLLDFYENNNFLSLF